MIIPPEVFSLAISLYVERNIFGIDDKVIFLAKLNETSSQNANKVVRTWSVVVRASGSSKLELESETRGEARARESTL